MCVSLVCSLLNFLFLCFNHPVLLSRPNPTSGRVTYLYHSLYTYLLASPTNGDYL